MTKLEYSDRQKFLSSIGIALIAISVLLPWIFLRESFDLMISNENLNHLTPTSQEILKLRLSRIQEYLEYLPYVSSGLMILGLILLTYGLIAWSKIQSVKDQIEEENLKRLEEQASEMSPDFIKLKPVRELEKIQEDSNEVASEAKPYISEVSEKSKAKGRLNGAVKYAEIESKLIERLRQNIAPEMYELLSNRIIGNRSFDAILASKMRGGADLLIEIKYFSKFPNLTQLHRVHDRQLSVQSIYESTTGRESIGYIFIVLSDDVVLSIDLISKAKSLDAGKKQMTILVKESEISKVDINKLYLDYVLS